MFWKVLVWRCLRISYRLSRASSGLSDRNRKNNGLSDRNRENKHVRASTKHLWYLLGKYLWFTDQIVHFLTWHMLINAFVLVLKQTKFDLQWIINKTFRHSLFDTNVQFLRKTIQYMPHKTFNKGYFVWVLSSYNVFLFVCFRWNQYTFLVNNSNNLHIGKQNYLKIVGLWKVFFLGNPNWEIFGQ